MPNDRIGELLIHPAAQKFPEMGLDDLKKLEASIRSHGVKAPIVLYGGQLVDGRNRVRAALLCGIPWTQLPKVNLPLEANPYRLAWMMNCERLDYAPAEKARINLEIEAESAALGARRKASKETANSKRSEAAKAQREREKSGGPPGGGQPDQAAPPPDRRKNNVAAQMAAEAGVSQRTMERVMGRIANGGSKRSRLPKKVRPSETWRVPSNIRKLAAFLLERLPSDEVRELAHLLLGQEEVAA